VLVLIHLNKLQRQINTLNYGFSIQSNENTLIYPKSIREPTADDDGIQTFEEFLEIDPPNRFPMANSRTKIILIHAPTGLLHDHPVVQLGCSDSS
jgi:hypothetical protein